MPSGGGGNTTTTQKADPWSGQQPFLTGGAADQPGIYSSAAAAFQGAAPQYYPGNTYAGLTPAQQAVQGQMINFGQSGGGDALQAANSGIASTLSPNYTSGTQGQFSAGQGVLGNELSAGYLNPWNSPSFNTVVGNTLAKAIPVATSSFTNGNRSDSGLATRAATMAATDSVGQLAQNQYQANQAIQNSAASQATSNYLTQQGNQVKAAGLAPLVDQTQMADLTSALQASGMSQIDAQNQIQAAMSRFNYGQMLPWNNLSLYENAIMGTGSPGGQTSTSQPVFDNTFGNVATGVGTAAALASAAAMLFSDRRLKTDIHRIGETDSGFPLYMFRYKAETPMARHIGVMAQDVEKTMPSAVSHVFGGVKMVDYAKVFA